MRKKLFFMLLLLSPWTAFAQTSQAIVADLSDREIRIDSRFVGTNLMLFGNRNQAGQVIVVIRGPERNFTIRKKERTGGIWMNSDKVTFKRLPYYYTVLASSEIPSDAALLKTLGIGQQPLFPTAIKNVSPALLEELKSALLKRQEGYHLYHHGERIEFVEDSLFKAKIYFPDRILRGRYLAEIYLIDDDEVRGMETIPLQVYKGGTDYFLSDLATRHSAVYGVMAVLVALVAGWLASTIFDKFYV